MNNRLRGYLSIFVAAFFWGSSATVAKSLFQHNVVPLLLIESRVIIAALVLLVFSLVARRDILKISFVDVAGFAILGIVGVAGANYTYYMAIQKMNVPLAILMQYTAPVFVAVYMLLTKRESISLPKTTAIVLALAGCTIMLGLLNPNVHIGVVGAVLGLSSALTFAFFNVYTKTAFKNYPLWTGITYTLLAGSAFWLLLDLFVRPSIGPFSQSVIWSLITFSMISVLIPYFFYFTGLRYLLPSTAVIISTMEPVVAIATAFLFVGERLGMFQAAGGILIVSAVVLLEVKRE